MDTNNKYVNELIDRLSFKEGNISLLEDKIKYMSDLLDAKNSEIRRYRAALRDIGAKLEDVTFEAGPYYDAPVWLKENQYIKPTMFIRATRIFYDRKFIVPTDTEATLEIINGALKKRTDAGD